MKPGDCLFIPAYHYYQFNAENLGTTQMGRKGLNRLQKKDGQESGPEEIHMAQVVSFKYEGNSELLKGIYDSIERGIIN